MLEHKERIKRIKYWDSTHSTSQLSKPIKPSEMEVVGFVIEETDEYITLAQEIIDGQEYFNQISIPKGAIVEGRTVLHPEAIRELRKIEGEEVL